MPSLSTAMAAEAAKAVNLPFLMIYLDVAGDPLWAWTGQVDINMTVASDPLLASGRTFVGSADVGSVSEVAHAADGAVQSVTLSLGHVDFTDPDSYDFINYVDKWSQRLAVIWIGYIDTVAGTIIADPARLMTGRMAHVAASDGSQPSITLKIVSKTAQDGLRANGWVLADAHQQAFYPGDKALEFVPQLVGKELRFGTPDPVGRATGNSIALNNPYGPQSRARLV